MPSCLGCKFFYTEISDGVEGQCRRYACRPVIEGPATAQMYGDTEADWKGTDKTVRWPTVEEWEWCGEWAAIEDD